MARNYKRLGGIINASAGPAKARAVFAGSFGILRENVVNLRENPVSSLKNPLKQCFLFFMHFIYMVRNDTNKV